ncbi:hypothetical protein [Singulisphaera sp. PoT]|uniref:hypothetical protein n=1 Tax=Singulisphaera sp. PoT TaxID=3411797 RepID=UPI003BF51588
MSESETHVAPGDPNAGAAIVLRMLQGAHPEDARAVRDWFTSIPGRLEELTHERDEWKEQALGLLFGHEELLADLREKTNYVNKLIADQERKGELMGERLRSFAKALESVVQHHVPRILAETVDLQTA